MWKYEKYAQSIHKRESSKIFCKYSFSSNFLRIFRYINAHLLQILLCTSSANIEIFPQKIKSTLPDANCEPRKINDHRKDHEINSTAPFRTPPVANDKHNLLKIPHTNRRTFVIVRRTLSNNRSLFQYLFSAERFGNNVRKSGIFLGGSMRSAGKGNARLKKF